MGKKKKIIYLVCLLFTFSWREDKFFKQKIDLNSQTSELQIPVEFDFSTDHLLKRRTLISFTFMMKFNFSASLYLANSLTIKESRC